MFLCVVLEVFGTHFEGFYLSDNNSYETDRIHPAGVVSDVDTRKQDAWGFGLGRLID